MNTVINRLTTNITRFTCMVPAGSYAATRISGARPVAPIVAQRRSLYEPHRPSIYPNNSQYPGGLKNDKPSIKNQRYEDPDPDQHGMGFFQVLFILGTAGFCTYLMWSYFVGDEPKSFSDALSVYAPLVPQNPSYRTLTFDECVQLRYINEFLNEEELMKIEFMNVTAVHDQKDFQTSKNRNPPKSSSSGNKNGPTGPEYYK